MDYAISTQSDTWIIFFPEVGTHTEKKRDRGREIERQGGDNSEIFIRPIPSSRFHYCSTVREDT